MAFLESPDIFRERMRPVFDKGVKDFESSHGAAKLASGVGGSIGAVVGLLFAAPKGVAAASYDYYDYSFGTSRGRGFYDYVTASPLVETAAAALVFGAIGAGLSLTGLHMPSWLNLSTTLFGGAMTYIGCRAGLGIVKAMAGTCSAGTGIGLSKGAALVAGKKPVVTVPPVENANPSTRDAA